MYGCKYSVHVSVTHLVAFIHACDSAAPTLWLPITSVYPCMRQCSTKVVATHHLSFTNSDCKKVKGLSSNNSKLLQPCFLSMKWCTGYTIPTIINCCSHVGGVLDTPKFSTHVMSVTVSHIRKRRVHLCRAASRT